MMRFAGKTVLVTGAAGGIGRAVARRLRDEGATLVLQDRDVEPVTALAASFGENAIGTGGDIAMESAMDDAIAKGMARFGRIDAAFLNAGTEGKVGALGVASLADFDRVMAINVRGPFIGLSRLFPIMKRQGGGSIVITSSTAGLRGSPGLAPYITSKHAVLGLMRTAALEGAPFGIRVNTLHPGPIDTAMIRSIEEGYRPGGSDAVRQAMITKIPLKRYGTPEEVAALLAYVLSDEAAFSTGSAFSIDGGIMAGTPAS
jgi:NAD(P)-dependent dehydrogenase (short-subunit alcohol dehydrogenase family)